MKFADAGKVSVLICLALFLMHPAEAEVMHHFQSDISIDQDGDIDVLETLDMDFQGEERHGIIRHIPVTYKRHQIPYSIVFKLVSITDGNDKPLHFQEMRDGAEEELKIGDPEKSVSGLQTYRIKYRVKRAINWLNGGPEFYWNATGDQWRFAIEKADAVVKAPKTISTKLINIVCFQGPPGSTQPAVAKIEDEALHFSCRNLQPGQGLTIALSMPFGTLHQPTPGEELLFWFFDWWQAVTIPVGAFLVMFWLWSTSGRDEDGGKAVAVEWNPPKELSPAEVGTLVDERCDLQDITSTLVDLAVRGHLKIKEIKSESFLFLTNKDYEFEKTDSPNASEKLKAAEQLFLNSVFPSLAAGTVVRLSSLKGRFYPYLAAIRDAVYDSLTTQKLFRHNPEQTRAIYLCTGFVAFFVALCSIAFSVPTAIGFLLAAIIIAAYAPAMPARTARGSQLTREALGFQRFVQKAEKERIRVLASEDPTIFGRLLPYAMVLGAADKWADAFKDLALEPPDWYVSSGGYNNYSTPLFVNDLGTGLRSIENTFTTPPASSEASSTAWSGGSAFNGGGSGGGFGGGGGSSW